jgi:uncharacterized protein (TIGR03000 family)
MHHRRIVLAGLLAALSVPALITFTRGQAAPGPLPASLRVLVPAGARLEIEGALTHQTGEVRRFQSPPLPPDRDYDYSLKVTWAGRTEVRTVRVRGGQETVVDLRPAQATGPARLAEGGPRQGPAPSEGPDGARALAARYKRPTAIPYPPDNPYSDAKARLGQSLFFDPRLSGSNWISCASCHNPSFAWGDALPKAIGHGMRELGRRTPTVLNLAWSELLFWDGRASSLAKCHSEWRFTDDSFHDTGLPGSDRGRGDVLSEIEVSQFAFKTPTLRNVTRRAPTCTTGV